jgi:hypothetical protein
MSKQKKGYWQSEKESFMDWVVSRGDDWKKNKAVYGFVVYLIGGLVAIMGSFVAFESLVAPQSLWGLLFLLFFIPYIFGIRYIFYRWDQE